MKNARVLFISQEITPYLPESELSVIGRYLPQGIQDKGKEIRTFIDTYIPASIPSVINHYTTGIFNTVLIWVYIVIMAVFLYYIVRVFVKRKKI